MTRTLDDLYDKVVEHQHLIGEYPTTRENVVPYIRDLVLASHVELTEFLNELPWKPWKHKGDESFSLARTTDELADVFIFLFDIALALHIRPSGIINQVYNKIDINIARLKSGQHKMHE